MTQTVKMILEIITISEYPVKGRGNQTSDGLVRRARSLKSTGFGLRLVFHVAEHT